ncbi:MAG: Gfo/Idh/MocA family oxidoreductase, partial [Pirellulaceae bacterium]|nr:Gfo/Idh/MocA family oxidoreductase [Pirellulaceae bacterium]
MKRLRLAVIGAGHLGRIHTRLAQSLDQFEVVAVIDPLQAARSQIAAEFDVPVCCSHSEVIDKVDAAIVATPTKYHHVVTTELLESGVHVFVEKPLTPTPDKAEELVALAREQEVVLQVGHVERFNPALCAVLPSLGNPKYVEAVRTSGYTFRSTDIGAVLDLMIHDLDIILSLMKSDLVAVQAIGMSMFGGHEDMAQARLQFADGCVANLTASRCSYVAQRHMQVFTETGYANIDFAQHTAKYIRPHESIMRR